MKKKRKIEVEIAFTEGWEERFARAAYNLYLRVENKSSKSIDPPELQSIL